MIRLTDETQLIGKTIAAVIDGDKTGQGRRMLEGFRLVTTDGHFIDITADECDGYAVVSVLEEPHAATP